MMIRTARESSMTSARIFGISRCGQCQQGRELVRLLIARTAQYLNCDTSFCRSSAILDSSSAELLVLLAPSVVLRAAWATPVMFWAISLLPLAASADVAADLAGRGRLLLDGAGDRVLDVVDLVDDLADLGDGFDGAFGVALDGLDLAADVLGGLGGLLGQLLDLVGDDGEALARLAGAGRLDGGVQGQQVRLLGDAR